MDGALPLLRLPAALSDRVILLDAHTIADAEAHLEGEDEEMRLRFDSPRPATLAETRAAMTRWIDGRAAGEPMFAYALRDASSRRLVGGCELRMLTQRSANVSYWVFPNFRRQGYAARALALLCEAATHIETLERIEAHIAHDNLASRRVAEHAGFVEVGSVQETSWAGATTTMALYARPMTGRRGKTRVANSVI